MTHTPPSYDIVTRLNAALEGRYRVDREIGAGGMATVYLAEDAKHHRKVAIKVLREDLGASVGAARFLREIEIAAQLQHPNILPLLDSGEVGGLLYYVMPFVEGQSLRQKLAHDRELPIGDAIRVVVEIVDALAYAHSRGVVHRDIKPDNVMLSGRHALITDFGVARAVSEATGGSNITSMGVALGTPAYMAPEQATADPNVDHRADIYAAGVVAYELLAGRTPFQSTTPQQMLAAHVTETPDPVSKHRPGVSPQLDSVVMRCLAKRPADRWQSSGELLAALEPLATPSGGMQPTSARMAAVTVGGTAVPWRPIAIAAGLLAVAFGVWTALRPSAPWYQLGASAQLTTDAGLEIHPAISPDGKFVAYAAGTSQQMRIYIRPTTGGRTIQLTDDSAAVESQPRWSPNGNQLLFLVRGGVSVASALGGSARAIIPGTATLGVSTAAWSPDGARIAFGRGESLYVASAAGGDARLVAAVGRGQPIGGCSWSRDATWIACVTGNPGYLAPGPGLGNIAPSIVVVVPSVGGALVAVSEDSSKSNHSPLWSPTSDEIFFVSNRDGPSDIYVRRVGSNGRGTGVAIRLTTGANAHSISITNDATRLAYSVYTSQANIWALPIPASGTVTIDDATRVTTGNQTVESMQASPDGRWIVYDSNIGGPAAIYRIPTAGGTPEQLASETFNLFAGDLSPNGREVAYHSFRNGTRDIEVKALDGSPPVPVTDTPEQERYPAWAPDGNAIAYDQGGPSTVFVARRSGGAWERPRQVGFGERPRWMPDGIRLAFVASADAPGDGGQAVPGSIVVATADLGASRAVFVPGAGTPVPTQVQPSVDGRTIYFKAYDAQRRAQFWAIPVAGGTPRLLVRFADPARPSNRTDFAVDAKRFYFAIDDRQSDIWVAELKRR